MTPKHREHTNAPCVWQETAPQPIHLPRLASELRADVIIIGGGFTGLSAAHYLTELGFDAVILERAEPGWGASGRNGGMLVPRPKTNYTDIAHTYGATEALRQRQIQREAVETVEALIAAHKIPCQYARAGYIAAAHSWPAPLKVAQLD
jgi:gamma-glutamylputrescine oxidase